MLDIRYALRDHRFSKGRFYTDYLHTHHSLTYLYFDKQFGICYRCLPANRRVLSALARWHSQSETEFAGSLVGIFTGVFLDVFLKGSLIDNTI